MKNILAWVKSNLLIVIFCFIVLAALPTTFAVSSAWRERIRSEREKAANDEMGKISKADVSYTIPSYDPGQKPVEYKGAPNSEITAWFKRERESLATAAESLVKRAAEFNRGVGNDAAAVGRSEHRPLVDGLFPDPKVIVEGRLREQMGESFDAKTPEEKAALIQDAAEDLLTAKLNEMEEVLLGKRGRPDIYADLLSSINAGPPADPIAVNSAIKEMFTRESDKITAGKRALTQDEQEGLVKRLADRRLAEYQAVASQRSLFATPKIWPQSPQKGFSSIPRGKIDLGNISLEAFFVNQWDYWVYNDVLAAIRLANGDRGNPVGVANAVVKRIESFQLADPEGLYGSADPMGDMNATQATPPASDVPGLVPRDWTVSITGRGMGSWNTMYDVRRVTLTVIVSSARINEFLDAIARTNFMSVTDLDLQAVDIWNDLREGYYYGPEHVVRATIGIETVWLRGWTSAYMPPDVAGLLGAPASEGVPGAAPVTSQPPSNRGRKGG
ncbi:MAG: hypothetical protein JNK25_11265 [Phycisphaerae bacterium]|nr:hypothetical protein [Phycisphaerae bacterium]